MESPCLQGLRLKTGLTSQLLDTLLSQFRWGRGAFRMNNFFVFFFRPLCSTTKGHHIHQQGQSQAATVTIMEELEDTTMALSPLTFSLVLQGSRKGTGPTPWTRYWSNRSGTPDSLYLFRSDSQEFKVNFPLMNVPGTTRRSASTTRHATWRSRPPSKKANLWPAWQARLLECGQRHGSTRAPPPLPIPCKLDQTSPQQHGQSSQQPRPPPIHLAQQETSTSASVSQ